MGQQTTKGAYSSVYESAQETRTKTVGGSMTEGPSKLRFEKEEEWTTGAVRKHIIGELKKDGWFRIKAWREEGTCSDIYDLYGTPKDSTNHHHSTFILKLFKTDPVSLYHHTMEEEMYTKHIQTGGRFLRCFSTGTMPELKCDISGWHIGGGCELTPTDKFVQLKEKDNFLRTIKDVPYLILEKVPLTLSKLTAIESSETHGIPPKLVFRLVLGCLLAISAFHLLGFVHRHITPANFGARCSEKKKMVWNRMEESVVLFDFGMAKSWPGDEPSSSRLVACGSARYASIQAHNYLDHGPVDDLWSLFYMLVEWLSATDLPWFQDGDNFAKAGDTKNRHSVLNLSDHCPEAHRHVVRDMGMALEGVTAYQLPPTQRIKDILQSVIKPRTRNS